MINSSIDKEKYNSFWAMIAYNTTVNRWSYNSEWEERHLKDKEESKEPCAMQRVCIIKEILEQENF